MSKLKAFVDTCLCVFVVQNVVVKPFELIIAFSIFLEFERFVNLAVCEAGLED